MRDDEKAKQDTAPVFGAPLVGGPFSTKRSQTVNEKLLSEKRNLEDRLELINRTLFLLEPHPEVQEVVDTLQKLGWVSLVYRLS
jgi:hypothetical protein